MSVVIMFLRFPQPEESRFCGSGGARGYPGRYQPTFGACRLGNRSTTSDRGPVADGIVSYADILPLPSGLVSL
ncbi:hypothetical protein [Nocardia aurea]|uniref:hypothetical protein n=1 Tax=Nocardia aurea TaxID=2144174 RepID=UPI0033AEA742